MPKVRFFEHYSRSIIKAISFRMLIIISDALILYVITRRLDLVLGVISLFTLVNTTIYFFHERFWNSIHWGKTGNNN